MKKTVKEPRALKGLSALLSQEETLGRRDSLLEKAMQHQDTTQGKRKCPKPVPALQSLRRMTLVRGMEIPGKAGNPKQTAEDPAALKEHRGSAPEQESLGWESDQLRPSSFSLAPQNLHFIVSKQRITISAPGLAHKDTEAQNITHPRSTATAVNDKISPWSEEGRGQTPSTSGSSVVPAQ